MLAINGTYQSIFIVELGKVCDSSMSRVLSESSGEDGIPFLRFVSSLSELQANLFATVIPLFGLSVDHLKTH